MAVGDFADRLRTMAENVLTLEVNTIICPHIEAEKMPPPEHAFIDVANEYRAWMRDRHNRDTWKPDEVASASREIFLMVRRAAGELLEAATERGVSDKNLLERIKTNSDQAIGIFDRLDAARGTPVVLVRSTNVPPVPIDLHPEEIVVLRKMWELMLDEVMMQTTIQLDGDVVTRLRRGLSDDPEGPTIMKLHDKAVGTSTAFWGKLIDVLGGAVKSLGELLFGKK